MSRLSVLPLASLAGLAGALVATGCTTELSTSADWVGCEDYDFDEPRAPELSAEVVDGAVVVSLANVLQPADADFDPEIAVDGKDIEVMEAWTAGEEADFCFTPQVTIEGAKGKLQIYWFRPGESIAYDNLEIKVD